MNKPSRAMWIAVGLVLGWRLVLFIFTSQPVPANDAFFFDGAVVNWLSGGGYFNPSIAECFKISGTQVFSAYPPLYQGALIPWMWVFGTSVLSAMGYHLFLFTLSALLITLILGRAFGSVRFGWLPLLFLCAITFTDRPDDQAHMLGLCSVLLTVICLGETGHKRITQLGLTLSLLAGLFTSPVGGALYFGIAAVAAGAAWLNGKRPLLWVPFVMTPLLAIVIAIGIAKAYPLAWQGFLENSAQTPVRAHGFRIPGPLELVKILRNAPVFFLFVACIPFWWKAKRNQQSESESPKEDRWVYVSLGAAIGGWALLLGAMVLFTANYVSYVLFAQILLATGVLAIAETFSSRLRWFTRAALLGCLALVSVRAVGMSTWGVACACDVSRSQALDQVRKELDATNHPQGRVVASSAYLYEMWRLGRRDAIHTDWTRDRRDTSPDADVQALLRLRPPRLFLTQFDYYRVYQRILAQLSEHPEQVTLHVRNTAHVPSPDSIPSMRRVVQHVSWAPVIVELDWKEVADDQDEPISK